MRLNKAVTAILVTRTCGYGNTHCNKMKRKDNKNVTVTAQWLANKGYSITRAAQAAEVSPSHLAKVLKGERKPSSALVQRLRDLTPYHPVKCQVDY